MTPVDVVAIALAAVSIVLSLTAIARLTAQDREQRRRGRTLGTPATMRRDDDDLELSRLDRLDGLPRTRSVEILRGAGSSLEDER